MKRYCVYIERAGTHEVVNVVGQLKRGEVNFMFYDESDLENPVAVFPVAVVKYIKEDTDGD